VRRALRRLQFLEQQDTFLNRRDRGRPFRNPLRNPARVGRCCGLERGIKQRGEALNRGGFKEAAEEQRDAVIATEPRENLLREQGVATEREEIVPDANLCNAQRFLP
jgi:hypothetical protein